MFVAMPKPLEHVLIVHDHNYLYLINYLYGKWSITFEVDDKNEISLLDHLGQAVQNTIYLEIEILLYRFRLYYTSDTDYAMGLLVK